MSAEAFREDADPARALARERRLQECRGRLNVRMDKRAPTRAYRPWSGEDLEALEWVEALAAAGHVGAERVLQRVIGDSRLLEQLDAAAPGRLPAFAARWSLVASFLARRECARPQPDLELAHRYFAVGHADDPRRAEALRELRAATGAPAPADLAVLREDLEESLALARERAEHRMLFAFAKWRLDSADEDARRAGRALMARAAALGSVTAQDRLFADAFEAAPRKPVFLEAWVASGASLVPSAVKPYLQLGADRERGAAGRPPNLEQAITWYGRALGRSARTVAGALDADFCDAVAHAFDRRWKPCVVDDAEIAMRWHERGLELGDVRGMETWLKACAEGKMGLAADPAAALERARRYCASGVDLKERRWRIMSAIRAVHAAAAAQSDPRLAGQWREVAALLERD